MRRIILALIATFTLALTPHSPVFVESDAANPITVNSGEEFFIALSSNVSTGYSWTQTMTSDQVVAYEGNVRRPADQATPGAPGEQIFIYHANRSGTATIVLTYTRAFEPDAPPAKTLTYTVNVP